MTKINVAICYFGMTRSTKFVYKTHKDHIINIFKNNDIDYDIYMHTWKTDCNMIWEKVYNEPVDYSEYKLLNPSIYTIDDQNEFLKTIDMSHYFDKEKFAQYGGNTPHEWHPGLIRNHLCALESKKRCYNLVLDLHKKYRYIMFVRPDVLVNNDIDWNMIKKSNFDIIIPNTDHNEGYNDRFAIIPFEKAEKYASRIDEIIDFRKKRGRIVSEKYVKYIIDIYYTNVLFMNFNMTIIRPNGQNG